MTVQEQEFISIVGPSGCGKSTLLHLLAGLIQPSEGEILLGGVSLNDERDKIALMPQRDQLFEWRTVLKNVLLSPEIKRTKTEETEEYAKSLLVKYGLKDFMHKRPSELSGGMRQRVALIRTLVGSPKLLLLDEPFSALDFQTRLNVCDDVQGIIEEEKKTAILVTHDIGEAISMSSKIIVLTSRPARIKTIYNLDIDRSISPFKRREHKNFNRYFQLVWKDLEGP
jgi:NitT/TauT family transport system ATP-binding protein